MDGRISGRRARRPDAAGIILAPALFGHEIFFVPALFAALGFSERIAQKQKKRYIQAAYKDSSQSFLSINKTRSILFFEVIL